MMKSLLAYLFLVTLFVCLSVKHATSIKCYDCKTDLLNSTADAECRDKFDNSITRECAASVCSVVVRTQANGEGSVTRSCGSEMSETIGGAVPSSEDHGEYHDNGALVAWRTCVTDMCNWDLTHQHRTRRGYDFSVPAFPAFPVVPDIPADHTGGSSIRCYNCITNPLEQSGGDCRDNMIAYPCPTGACRIYKITMAGDDVVLRMCENPLISSALTLRLPKEYDRDNGKITRFGISLSWSKCTTNLCNWGVVNKYQMSTLFASVMLSLSVYCTIF